MKKEITSLRKLRAAFWSENPECARLRKPGPQNNQNADVRVTFCDWLDNAEREGRLASRLADTATL